MVFEVIKIQSWLIHERPLMSFRSGNELVNNKLNNDLIEKVSPSDTFKAKHNYMAHLNWKKNVSKYMICMLYVWFKTFYVSLFSYWVGK